MIRVTRFLLAVAAGMLGAWLAAPPVARAAGDDARLIMVPDLIRRGDITYPDPIPVNGPNSGLWKLSPDIVAEAAALELLQTRKGPVPAIQVAMIGHDKAMVWYVGSEIDAAALVISRRMIDLLSDPAWRGKALGLLAARGAVVDFELKGQRGGARPKQKRP